MDMGCLPWAATDSFEVLFGEMYPGFWERLENRVCDIPG